MKFLASSALAAPRDRRGGGGARLSAEYPERNITVIVPFPAGGASDMTARLIAPKLAERVKQIGRHRQSGRRQRRARRGGAQAGARRRLHAADRLDRRVRHQSRAVQGSALRSAEGFRSAERRGAHAQRAGGESRLSGQQRPRADRAPEEESRQGHVRVVRHRIVGPSDRRAVLAEDRHDRHPRAVSRRRAGHQRSDRRPRQRVVPEPRRDRAAGEEPEG